MTTIVTRIYSDEAAANAVADELRAKSFPESTFDVIAGGGDVSARMAAAQVADPEAAVYGPMVEAGNALVVVRAPFAPFGAARTAMAVVDAGSPMPADVEEPNRYIRHEFSESLKDQKIQHGYWASWPIPHISHREPARESTIRHGFYADFLVPLLSKREPSRSMTIRHGFWGNFLVPLLSKRTPSRSMTIRHGFWGNFLVRHLVRTDRSSHSKSDPRFPFSNMFGLPLLTKR